MALTGYLQIIGEKQEEIESDLDKDGHEGSIPFHSFEHKIAVPEFNGIVNPGHDPVHGMIKLIKRVDETTPKLYRALCTKEPLTEVNMVWVEHVDGQEEEIYRIELEHCFLVAMRAQGNSRGEEKEEHMEECLDFSYQTIRWHYGEPDGDQFFDYDTMRAD